MPYYEMITEPGNHSVMFADSDEEVLSGIKEQHRRAVNGEEGGPTGHPAERVKRILVYDEHPDDHNVDKTLSADEITSLVKAVKDKNGVVNIDDLIQALNDQVHPMIAKERAHDSQFKMKEARELDSSLWTGVE